MNKQFSLPKLGLLLAAGLALSPYTVVANESLDEILVTTKNNRSLEESLPTAHIFTRKDIELSQARDIPELLNNLSGIGIADTGGRGSVTSVFVRGSSNSQIIVLIDGVRVGSASLGSAALNSYPIEAIDRVEVVKGPLSSIYGADASGGTIHLFTKKGASEGMGSVNATIGTDSLVDYGIAFQGGNDKHSFHISAQAEETDGIDRTSIVSGGNDDDDGYEETAVSLGAKVSLTDSTTANLSVLYSDNTSQFDNTFGADTGFETDTTTLSSALNISSQLNENLVWTTTLGINEDESVTEVFFSDITTKRNSLGTEMLFSISDTTTVTVGADYYDEEIETSNDFPVTDRDNTGVFALLQNRTGALSFLASLRYDDNSAYGSDTNSNIAVGYEFSDQLEVVASYGTAFAAPSFNFLYFPFFGNPDLVPEESESFEISLMGNNAKLGWRVSAYRTEYENLFSFDPNTFLAANIGSAEIEGVEFELNTQLVGWELSANLDLLSAENKDTGVELDDRAETTFSIVASRSFGDLDLRFKAKHEDGRFDAGGTELDNYTLLDVSAAYQINERLSVQAIVENLFDKDYTVNLIGFGERYNTQGTQARLTARYAF